ncbi:MAG: GNAT family N-acetyltransferase [Clostridiales bacterium]|nr:GNAT family N-acetyltransferase [Clostridiales bacterium]
MYTTYQVNYDAIELMKVNYYKNLTAPMDDMWEEGIIPACDFYIIKSDIDIGYFALDKEGVLLVFHVEEAKNADEIFDYILTHKNIQKAYVSTYDPIFYSQCLRCKKSMSINTLLYKQSKDISISAPFHNIDVTHAELTDLESTARFFREKVDITGDWIESYLERLISNDGFILFKYNNDIIGTGGIRPSISSKGYVNIGMTVSRDYRRRGLASYIVCTIKEICKKNNYQTICSTTNDNIGSQKTLTQCGYECYHKIYTVDLN